MTNSLESKTGALYELPQGAFTAGRDALAAQLKASGQKDDAETVKRLRKPSLPAWVANQLVRRFGTEWSRLAAASDALRRKQGEAAPAAELRQAVAEQREALRACETRATQLLADHGPKAAAVVLQKVSPTLLALAYGAPGVVPGALDRELQPPGFEAFAGVEIPPLAPAAPKTKAAPEPSEPLAKRERAHAEARLAASEKAEASARAEVERWERHLARLESELETARRAGEAARQRLLEAESEHAAARAALGADPGAMKR